MNQQTPWLFEAPLLEARPTNPRRSGAIPAPVSQSVSAYPPDGQIMQRTVYGWGSYRRRVEELPPDQRAVLIGVGEAIKNSFHRERNPVRTVQVYGHADWDTPRNPQREQQMSQERAKAATNWLQAYVGQPVAAQIQWQTQGLGATQLKAPPTTEANRRQNRRVEVLARRGAGAPPRPKPTKPAIEILFPRNKTIFAISAVPAMPAIEARARIVGVTPDPTSATLFEWKAEIKHDARICINGPNRIIKAPNTVETLKGDQSFKPSFNFILGGELTITVKAKVNGKVLTARTKGLRIEGTNPDCTTLRTLLPKLLFQMACHESHLQQFRTPSGMKGRCPLYSGDKLGGVGLFQITNPRPTHASHWDWRANLEQMKDILADKIKFSRSYPAQVRRQRGFKELVDRFNRARKKQGKPELTITLPDFTEGDFNNPGQLELDAIRGFNGFAGHDQFGLHLHEFRVAVDPRTGLLRVAAIDERARTGVAVWERVPASARPRKGDPDYVNHVLKANCSDVCGAVDKFF